MEIGAPKRGAKPDEWALWARVVAGERPRDDGRDLRIPENRVWYLCLKWARAGIYEYGVSADLGWPIRIRGTSPCAVEPIGA